MEIISAAAPESTAGMDSSDWIILGVLIFVIVVLGGSGFRWLATFTLQGLIRGIGSLAFAGVIGWLAFVNLLPALSA